MNLISYKLFGGINVNFKTRITFTICFLIVIVTISLGTLIYIKSAAILNKEAERYMISQLNRAQENIDLLLEINKLETRELALSEEVKLFLLGKVSTKDINNYLIGIQRQKNKADNAYMDHFILNTKGYIVATCLPYAMNLDLSTREYFLESKRTGKTVTSDFLISRSDKSYIVITVSPIKDDNGNVLGYAGISIFAEHFSKVVSNLKLGETGYFAFIDSNNIILSHPNKDLIGKKSIYSITEKLLKSKNSNRDSIIKTSFLDNKIKQIQIYKFIKNKDWILIAILPEKEMHIKSQQLLNSVFLIGIISLLFAMVLGIYVSNKISYPIVKVTKYLNEAAKGSSIIDESISKSIKMLRQELSISKDSVEDDIINENKKKSKISLKSLVKYFKSFENESENLIKTAEQLAVTIEEISYGTGRFISTLSHDLKNSIAIIKGFAKGLKMGIITDEKIKKEFIEGIYNKSIELEKISCDILDSAYEAQCNIKIYPQKVDLENLCNELINSAKQYVENFNRKVEFEIKVSKGYLMIDITKILRVWNNLLSNAVKYSPEDKEIKINIIQEKDQVKFMIEDFGIGINKNEIDKIFNIFYRGSNVSKNGYGLGLFIAKSIIEAHNSKLFVESEEGKGSKFYFYLQYSPYSSNLDFNCE